MRRGPAFFVMTRPAGARARKPVMMSPIYTRHPAFQMSQSSRVDAHVDLSQTPITSGEHQTAQSLTWAVAACRQDYWRGCVLPVLGSDVGPLLHCLVILTRLTPSFSFPATRFPAKTPIS